MSDRITLSAMRFEGRHGVSEEERLLPQPFEVDLEVDADLSRAGRTDEVADTIDYGPLVFLCQGVVERNSFRLLETIAATIADRVLDTTSAHSVTVRVRKLAVPVEAELDWAQVQIRRDRSAPAGTR
jgi:7,8-dihydroneopterin aldolase/epimerase/oxygenase